MIAWDPVWCLTIAEAPETIDADVVAFSAAEAGAYGDKLLEEIERYMLLWRPKWCYAPLDNEPRRSFDRLCACVSRRHQVAPTQYSCHQHHLPHSLPTSRHCDIVKYPFPTSRSQMCSPRRDSLHLINSHLSSPHIQSSIPIFWVRYLMP